MDAATIAVAAAATTTLAQGLRRCGTGGPHYPPLRERALGTVPAEPFRFEVPRMHPALAEVLQEFKTAFAKGLHAEAQLSIYHRGERVLEASGCSRDNERYGPRSFQCVFSCTKLLTSVVFALLVDRGLLSYDDLVCKHWPELKAADAAKGQLTVAQLLRHEAGLPALPPGVHLTTELLHDLPRLAQFMAEQPLASTPGSRRAYHAVTAGFLLNEVCRRVDPQRRTVGQLIQQDIATPLNVPFFVGQGYPPPVTVAHVEPHHVEPHKQPPVLYALLHVWLGTVPLLLLARGAAAAAARRQVLNYAPRLSAANRGLWGIMREMDHGPRGCARMFNRCAIRLGWGDGTN